MNRKFNAYIISLFIIVIISLFLYLLRSSYVNWNQGLESIVTSLDISYGIGLAVILLLILIILRDENALHSSLYLFTAVLSVVYMYMIFDAIYEIPLVREPQDLAPILHIARYGIIDPSVQPFFKETVTPPIYNAMLLMLTGIPCITFMTVFSRLIFAITYTILLFLLTRKLGLPLRFAMLVVIYSVALDFQVHDIVGRCVYAMLLYILLAYLTLAKNGSSNKLGYSLASIPVIVSLGLSDPAFPVTLGASFTLAYPIMELIFSRLKERELMIDIFKCGMLLLTTFLAWMAFSCPHLAHLGRYIYERIVEAFTKYNPATYHPSLRYAFNDESIFWLRARLAFYLANALTIFILLIYWLLKRDLRIRMTEYEFKYMFALLAPSAVAFFIALYRLTYIPWASIAPFYLINPILNSHKHITLNSGAKIKHRKSSEKIIIVVLTVLLVVNLAFFTPITLVLSGGSIGFSIQEKFMSIWLAENAPHNATGVLITGKLPTYEPWIMFFVPERSDLKLTPYIVVEGVPSTRFLRIQDLDNKPLICITRNILTIEWTWKVKPSVNQALETLYQFLNFHNRILDVGHLYNIYLNLKAGGG